MSSSEHPDPAKSPSQPDRHELETQPMVISTDDPNVVDPMARTRRENPQPEATTVAETSTVTRSDRTQVPQAATIHTIEPRSKDQAAKKNSKSEKARSHEEDQRDGSEDSDRRRDRDDHRDPPKNRSWMSNAIMAGVAGLVIGLGIAFGYSYFSGSNSEDGGNSSGSQAKGGDSKKKGDSKSKGGDSAKKGGESESSSGNGTPGFTDAADGQDLRKQIEQLSERIDQMHQRMDSMSQPRNETPPDIHTLQIKVGEISRQIGDMGDVQTKVNQVERRLEMMQQDLKIVRDQVNTAHNRTSTTNPAAGIGEINKEVSMLTAPSSPAAPPLPPLASTGGDDTVLSEGIALFKEGKYAAAGDIFRKLQMSRSDDPRVWYLSALTFGLNTNDWNRGAMALLEKGVSREKTGEASVKTSQIDAVLNNLSTAQGRDWINYQRKLKLNP